MPASRAYNRLALLALAAWAILCFGPHLASAGFYLDDWVILDMFTWEGKPALARGLRLLANGGFWVRPLNFIHFPLLIGLGGLNPIVYRLALIGLNLAASWLLFRLVTRLAADPKTALRAAVLALLYPIRAAAHQFWMISIQLAAQVLVLASLNVHLEALSAAGSRRRRLLLLAQALYLCGLLEYDSVAFLPALLAAALWSRSGAREAARAMAPYAATLALAALYQRGLAPLLLEPSTRPIDPAILHVLDLYAEALRQATVGAAALAVESVSGGLQVFGPGPLLAGLAAAVALAVPLGGGPAPDRRACRLLIAAGAAGFLASYLPYAFTGTYLPKLQGVMSRVHAGGGLCAGVLLAGALGLVPARRWLLGLVLCASCACHWAAGSQWAQAWRMQNAIASAVLARLPPGPATVVLYQTPPHLQGAPIFLSHYDAGSALRLLGRRRDLEAVYGSVFNIVPGGVEVGSMDPGWRRLPFEGLFLYDGPTGRLLRIDGPAPLLELARSRGKAAG